MDSNFIRGLVFTQAGFVCLMSFAIIVRYAMNLALARRRDRAMPWHVVLISASYLWMSLVICLVIREKWGAELSYVAMNALGFFTLGDIALLFMLSHLFVQHHMQGSIVDHAKEVLAEEKRELAAELKKQTSGLAQMIRNVGEKADSAYNEANDVNHKIAGFDKAVNSQLTEIKENAETARIKASDVSNKADIIGETGLDTNERVRRIENKKL